MTQRVGEVLNFQVGATHSRKPQGKSGGSAKWSDEEKRADDVTQYALDRVCGRWPQFISRIEKHAKKIYIEWEKELFSWSHADVDGVMNVFERPEWRDRMKGHPPDLPKFLEAKRSSGLWKEHEKGKDYYDYLNYLRKWELRVLERTAKAKPGILFDLLMDARMFLAAAELGLHGTAKRCQLCTGFAVTMDREHGKNGTYCWKHSEKAYHDAMAVALEDEKGH